jgi:hypothetical protein
MESRVIEFARFLCRAGLMARWIFKKRERLGGDLDGCLREFGAFNENGLVRFPTI